MIIYRGLATCIYKQLFVAWDCYINLEGVHSWHENLHYPEYNDCAHICNEKKSWKVSTTNLHWCSKAFCSRLENPFSPGFPTGSTNQGLKGLKGDLFSPGWKHQPGVKGASRPDQGPPRGRTLSPGWCYQPGLNVLLFFPFSGFYFWFLFSFND